MPEYLTKKQAAAMLQVTERTIERWLAMGKALGAVKIERTIRYKRVALERFLKRCEL